MIEGSNFWREDIMQTAATHNWTRELWFNAMVPTKNLADMYLCYRWTAYYGVAIIPGV